MHLVAPMQDTVQGGIVSLLDVDPDLAGALDPIAAQRAAREVVAPRLVLPAGTWDPAGPAPGDHPWAVLVVRGMLLRQCTMLGRTCSQFLGAGDVLALGESEIAGAVTCQALGPVTLAVLDDSVLDAVQRWPTLAAGLVLRGARWAERTLELQAISGLPRAEDRIERVLAHLAARWGRVTPDGVVLPLPLTHAELGRLVGARRPTVSLALRVLADEGAVRSHPDGWLLRHGAA